MSSAIELNSFQLALAACTVYFAARPTFTTANTVRTAQHINILWVSHIVIATLRNQWIKELLQVAVILYALKL